LARLRDAPESLAVQAQAREKRRASAQALGMMYEGILERAAQARCVPATLSSSKAPYGAFDAIARADARRCN